VAQEERLLRAITTNRQLIFELERSRASLLEAVNGLSEEQLDQSIDGGWSVKDHLIHLTIWDEMRFFEISRIARGGTFGFPPTPEIDWFNDPMTANRRNLSLQQVLTDLAFARDMVLQTVAICPEDRLDQSLYGEIGIEGGAAHDRSHAATILAWRKKEGI
jgi:hypothetical protein